MDSLASTMRKFFFCCWSMWPIPASSNPVTESYGVVSDWGPENNDQAGPVCGMGVDVTTKGEHGGGNPEGEWTPRLTSSPITARSVLSLGLVVVAAIAGRFQCC